jgi:hypothetical protein
MIAICGSPSGAEALTFKAFYGTAGSRAPSKPIVETCSEKLVLGELQ